MLPKPLRSDRVKPRRPIPRKSRVPAKSKTPRAKARRTADAVWAKTVKERAYGLCERSLSRGRVIAGTDAHHVVSRRYAATRHLLENGVLLSRTQHRIAHLAPLTFKAWFKRRFPERWAAITEAAKEKKA